MKIAVEGCAHGELEMIYNTIQILEERHKVKVDLLICCGDFQAVRNRSDLQCMAVPIKYQQMCSFYKYYSGEKVAPILTIFIGGNHEASNYLSELHYGGWVAPNIYYLGSAGVVEYNGVRIAGMSGIYKGHDYLKGHFECAPFDEQTKRSVYHLRNLEVFRLKQLSGNLDVFLSHDWPRGIYHHGNVNQLLKRKPYFRAEIESNELGSKPGQEIMERLKPSYYFAGHLHVKFASIFEHKSAVEADGACKETKFLALDKCLPRRQFLQLVDIESEISSNVLRYDLEWLTILHLTNHLLTTSKTYNYMPGPNSQERFNFTPTEDELAKVRDLLGNELSIPLTFERTAPVFDPIHKKGFPMPNASVNPQTSALCQRISVTDPIVMILGDSGLNTSRRSTETLSCSWMNESEANVTQDDLSLTQVSMDPNEISIDDEDSELISSESSDERSALKSKLFTTGTSFTPLKFKPLTTEESSTLSSSSPSEESLDTGITAQKSCRLSLSLPPPRTPDTCREKDIAGVDIAGEKRSSPIVNVSSHADVSYPALGPIELCMSAEASAGTEKSPSAKRFKRRNVALYSFTNDDESDNN